MDMRPHMWHSQGVLRSLVHFSTVIERVMSFRCWLLIFFLHLNVIHWVVVKLSWSGAVRAGCSETGVLSSLWVIFPPNAFSSGLQMESRLKRKQYNHLVQKERRILMKSTSRNVSMYRSTGIAFNAKDMKKEPPSSFIFSCMKYCEKTNRENTNTTGSKWAH